MANRLIHETSPYLLQHAHNPVDWYPWSPEALERAKSENKPILVSIGYSACHWCHVMERESFENTDTAALMNEWFINIKIDREERPDLDHIYMDAVQMISGSGGWPLNVFLTPDAKPFYGGTYFPPLTAYNRSSWPQVLRAIHQAWLEKPEDLLDQAESLTNHIRNASLYSKVQSAGAIPGTDDLRAITDNLLKSADKAWGGFGTAPKFPQTFSIRFLLRQHFYLTNHFSEDTKEADFELAEACLGQALLSLDKMIMGGIYDQLGGGFARYSVDGQWFAPHFEKMLYDNALLVSAISEAYQITRKESYLEAIEQTMHFIQSEWQDADGGLFSAFDADSEGVEGKFYTWTWDELKSIITEPAHFEWFCAYFGVEEGGNWEETNILWVAHPLEIFCEARGLDYMATKMLFDEYKNLLLHHRSKRIKPLLDNKKIMGWNALLISGACQSWCATGNRNYLEMAEKAADFIEAKLSLNEGHFYAHNYNPGKPATPAFLDDICAYIGALIILQECTGKTQYLESALRLTDNAIFQFFDEASGYFFYTSQNQEDVIFRKQEVYDGATPSGNSMMARNLFYLGTLVDKPEWIAMARSMVMKMKDVVLKYSGSFGNWAALLQELVYGLKEVVIVGEQHKQFAGDFLNHFVPGKVLQHAAKESSDFPLLRYKKVPENATMIYLCEHYNCLQPVTEIESLIRLIKK